MHRTLPARPLHQLHFIASHTVPPTAFAPTALPPHCPRRHVCESIPTLRNLRPQPPLNPNQLLSPTLPHHIISQSQVLPKPPLSLLPQPLTNAQPPPSRLAYHIPRAIRPSTSFCHSTPPFHPAPYTTPQPPTIPPPTSPKITPLPRDSLLAPIYTNTLFHRCDLAPFISYSSLFSSMSTLTPCPIWLNSCSSGHHPSSTPLSPVFSLLLRAVIHPSPQSACSARSFRPLRLAVSYCLFLPHRDISFLPLSSVRGLRFLGLRFLMLYLCHAQPTSLRNRA